MTQLDIKKINDALEYLSIFLDVNLNNEKERYLLIKAIKYANINNYYPNSNNIHESASSDIFLIIAESTFRCSLLDKLKDSQQIREIKNYQYQRIHEIKLGLPMKGRFLNYKQ